MINLKLKVPLSKDDNLTEGGAGYLEISRDCDSHLVETYSSLKEELNTLLEASRSELRLIGDLRKIEYALERRRSDLQYVEQQIVSARKQLDRVGAFLRRLGVEPSSSYLEINESMARANSELVAIEAANAEEGEVEEDRIPFNDL